MIRRQGPAARYCLFGTAAATCHLPISFDEPSRELQPRIWSAVGSLFAQQPRIWSACGGVFAQQLRIWSACGGVFAQQLRIWSACGGVFAQQLRIWSACGTLLAQEIAENNPPANCGTWARVLENENSLHLCQIF